MNESEILQADVLDNRIISLPCYEPAGKTIELSARDLLRHLLLIGQTGSGKTTILNRILNDLIQYKDSNGKNMGLLILDSQDDGTAIRVRQMAADAGREEDVKILSSEEGFYNPMGELNSFANLSLAVSILVSASRINHSSKNDNPYWAETTQLLIESGLTILALTENDVSIHRTIEFISDLLLASKWNSSVEKSFQTFTNLCATKISRVIKAKLELISSTITSWKSFDSGTKGILKTCLEVTLAPFLSATALPYWDDRKKGDLINPAEALSGKIIIISTRGSAEPETAGLISRLAKIQFYRAAQARSCLGNNHLAGIVMDEFPLAITEGGKRWSDVTNLATLRSKGIAVVAATQGLINLDLAVDSKVTSALVVNFSNLIFLRSQEIGSLSELAYKVLGSKPALPQATRVSTASGELWVLHSIPRGATEPVCPEGALARLEPHQSYISLANGFRTLSPVWLCPLYYDTAAFSQSIPPEDRDFLLLKGKITSNASTSDTAVCLWYILNNRPKHAFTLNHKLFASILAKLGHSTLRMSDLESIPNAWRKGIIGMTKRLPSDVRLKEIRCTDCHLHVSFESTSSTTTTYLEQSWKRSVYPSCLRRPNRKDRIWLSLHFPNLLKPKNPINNESPFTDC